MAYLLDADVFIRAKNLHYGFDFCPAFWDWLIQQNNESNVYSIEKVFDELLAVEDELAEWSGDRGDLFFLRPDTALLPALATVSEWVTGQSYDQSAVSTFFQKADYYLVAQAHASQQTVVTHEQTSTSPVKSRFPTYVLDLESSV